MKNRPCISCDKEFDTSSIDKQTRLGYSISSAAGETLQGKQVPVVFNKQDGEHIYINGFTAQNESFSSDYQQADSLVDKYIALPRIQECCFDDKESIAQLAAIHEVGSKYYQGDVSTQRNAYYEKNRDTTITNTELLRSGLGMCSEQASHTGGYLDGCGFSYELLAGNMGSEPHNIILGNIEGIPVFIDNNPVGTDDTGNPIPPLYKKEGNIGRHFLYPDITIEFVS